MSSQPVDVDLLTSQLSHAHFYRQGRLESDPSPYKDQAEPKVIYVRQFSNVKPQFSLVIPVHNQESIILRTLSHVFANTVRGYELIIILDYCTDGTEEILINHLDSFEPPTDLCLLCIVSQSTPVFETTSDNIGFSLSRADIVIEIQADMIVDEYAYNDTLAKPLVLYDDFIAVSGRSSHTFNQIFGIGKLGHRIERKLPRFLNKRFVYMMGTCNRGPLALRRDRLETLGFFDEKNFFLNDSDHDLFARAYHRYGWRCGYVPIEVISRLAEGSSRKPTLTNTTTNKDLNHEIKLQKTRTCTGGYLRSCSSLPSPPIEVRPLNSNYTSAFFWLLALKLRLFWINFIYHLRPAALKGQASHLLSSTKKFPFLQR